MTSATATACADRSAAVGGPARPALGQQHMQARVRGPPGLHQRVQRRHRHQLGRPRPTGERCRPVRPCPFRSSLPDASDHPVPRIQGELLLATDDFGGVRLYNCPVVSDPPAYRTEKGHSSHVSMARFTCDGQLAISVGGHDRTVMQWMASSFLVGGASSTSAEDMRRKRNKRAAAPHTVTLRCFPTILPLSGELPSASGVSPPAA